MKSETLMNLYSPTNGSIGNKTEKINATQIIQQKSTKRNTNAMQ